MSELYYSQVVFCFTDCDARFVFILFCFTDFVVLGTRFVSMVLSFYL